MAIAYDNSTISNPGVTEASKTFSHTVNSNTNGILFVYVLHDANSTTDNVTGVTYAGVAMTSITSVAGIAANVGATSVWYLVAPASGANNVVISYSPDTRGSAAALSYTGASQTGQPDSSATHSTALGPNAVTVSTTTVADNAWGVMSAFSSTGSDYISGTNCTVRVINNQVIGVGDTAGPVTPAGALSMTLTNGGGIQTGILVSFAPAGGAAATTHDLSLLGVGT